jgi:hypothetical protein
MRRGTQRRPDSDRSHADVSIHPRRSFLPSRSSTREQPHWPDPAPMDPAHGGPATVATHTEPPATARSVVSHHPSPPVLLVPSQPHYSWSTAISPVRIGHPSPPVTRRLVAMRSQSRAPVARLGVWCQIASPAAACAEHQMLDLVDLSLPRGVCGLGSHEPALLPGPTASWGRPPRPARDGLPGTSRRSSSGATPLTTWRLGGRQHRGVDCRGQGRSTMLTMLTAAATRKTTPMSTIASTHRSRKGCRPTTRLARSTLSTCCGS